MKKWQVVLGILSICFATISFFFCWWLSFIAIGFGLAVGLFHNPLGWIGFGLGCGSLGLFFILLAIGLIAM